MKTTLLSLSGISPAILTETVWALARETPPVVPDDVVVVSAAEEGIFEEGDKIIFCSVGAGFTFAGGLMTW